MNQGLVRCRRIAFLLVCGWLALSQSALAQFTGGGAGAGRSSRSSRTYPNSTEIGEANISVDQETRNLVVVTDAETARSISNVVTTLNRPAPQVLIRVVFLEVTHRKGLDVGVEGTYTRNFDSSTQGKMLQQFQGVSGLNSGSGIFNVVGSDYEITLRAIAEAGKLEVLSRPTILARNNQQATITVGQQVPLITNVRYDTFGNQINAITYQSVGIILRVTPFITSSGLVEMIVSPEISNLSDQTVAISTGTNSVGAPVINTRSADTVVVTPDGQTVVIGGLMQTTKTETVSKVPLLGDIPLLGFAFRRRVQNDTKTELLIFLTPHIVKDPWQLAGITATEKGETKIVPKAFSEQDLSRFLDSLPAKAEPVPAKPPK